MPGTVKLWWHDGSTLDARHHPTPLINEPERGFQTLSIGAAPVNSQPAPKDCVVAVIESDVAVRYLVRDAGQAGNANSPQAKPMAATGFRLATIGVPPGARISFVEV